MTDIKLTNRKKLRHRWSHQLWIHRYAVRFVNAVMRLVPFSIKYGVGSWLRRNEYPYKLLNERSVVVQIGAPVDTLGCGRSRAMHFSLLTRKGKAVIIEPDAASEKMFGKLGAKHGLTNINFCPVGAWSESKQLKLYVNKAHPATNFTEGTVEYDESRLREYDVYHVPVDSVDNILSAKGIGHVDLISITTNGSERHILQGMEMAMNSGTKYVCLAGTGEEYVELMGEYGYGLLAYDDRGFTFQRNETGERKQAA